LYVHFNGVRLITVDAVDLCLNLEVNSTKLNQLYLRNSEFISVWLVDAGDKLIYYRLDVRVRFSHFHHGCTVL
jgi:hypothetical protein